MRVSRTILSCFLGALLAGGSGGCGDDSDGAGPSRALIVVSPHPDDESILGAATIYRLAGEADRIVRAVYLSGGDLATVPGDCGDLSEERKTELIVQLREEETRAAWRVLAPEREVPIDFLRGLDQRLVASSAVVDGVREDVLSAEGQRVLEGAVAAATDLPESVGEVLLLTTSIYDAHPDHRVAYRAAREAAEILARDRGLPVEVWSWIVHDEVPNLDVATCCPGDFHWPAAGPLNDILALTDVPERPRPPLWTRVEEVGDLGGVRRRALEAHASQLEGNPELCMPVYVPSFYERWLEKIEEPFYVDLP